jgi:predicted RNase H-like nuclease
MVLAVAAAQENNRLLSLPDPPPMDRYGLPMRIVYSAA